MKTVTYEVRMRVGSSEDESEALLKLKRLLLDVTNALSVVQIGPVQNHSAEDVVAHGN